MTGVLPTSAVHSLMIGIVAALKEADGVRALVGERVYDEVPSDRDKPETPYVYLGPINRRGIEGASCIDAAAVTFRIFVVSTDFGRVEAWSVVEQIQGALKNKELKLTGPWSTAGDLVRALQDGDVIAPLDPKSAFADFTTTLTRTGD